MKPIYGYVYLITNQVNEKMYVGQTTRTVMQRWAQHRHRAKRGVSNAHLYNAMKKYAVDSFTVETIGTAYSKDELDRLECDAISRHDAMNPQRGYNEKEGGGNGKPSDILRQRLSESHRGLVRSEESRRRQSESLKGHPGYNRGMRMSPDTLKRMSAAHKGKQHCLGNKLTDEHKRNISEAVRGANHPNYGKQPSDTTRKKMQEASANRKKFLCPYCRNEYFKVHLEHWHGDKCKSRKRLKATEQSSALAWGTS